MTNDEVEDLKKKLDHIERTTAIWRSQVVVLLLVFICGGAAAILWTRASLTGRLGKVEAETATQKKVVEVEALVVKGTAGERRMEFRDGKQTLFDGKGMGRMVLKEDSLTLYDETGAPCVFASPEMVAIVGKDRIATFLATSAGEVSIPNLKNAKYQLDGPQAPKVTP